MSVHVERVSVLPHGGLLCVQGQPDSRVLWVQEDLVTEVRAHRIAIAVNADPAYWLRPEALVALLSIV